MQIEIGENTYEAKAELMLVRGFTPSPLLQLEIDIEINPSLLEVPVESPSYTFPDFSDKFKLIFNPEHFFTLYDLMTFSMGEAVDNITGIRGWFARHFFKPDTVKIEIADNTYDGKIDIRFKRGCETFQNLVNLTLLQLEMDIEIAGYDPLKKVKLMFDSQDFYILYDLLTLTMEEALHKHVTVFTQNMYSNMLTRQQEERERMEREGGDNTPYYG
jgi:hypothetical protein